MSNHIVSSSVTGNGDKWTAVTDAMYEAGIINKVVNGKRTTLTDNYATLAEAEKAIKVGRVVITTPPPQN
jgi:hypothetical protein